MKTTLAKIRAASPCPDGWEKLLRHLGKTKADDEPLSLEVVLDSNGLPDATWCLRAVDGYNREKRLFAVWCVRQVQHLMPDKRSIDALDVAERFANGEATIDELVAARDAAAYAADHDTANAAAYVAYDTANAAASYATAAASYATQTAAYAAADAAAAAASDYRVIFAAASDYRVIFAAASDYRVIFAAARAAQAAELSRVIACIDAGQDPYPKVTK